MNGAEILDREFLEMRARILELAACFDRIDRATGSVDDDAKMIRLKKGIEILSENRDDRAAAVQMLFSQPYKEGWATEFKLQDQI